MRVCYFFRAVYHSKNHVIPRPVIATILDVATLKTTTTCQSNSPNTTADENYQKIVINCDYELRLNLALNWRSSWKPSEIFQPSKPNQCPILIVVCIIRPLKIHKKSKLKCLLSSLLVR